MRIAEGRSSEILQPVRHQALPDIVVDHLRRAIINGELNAGDRLVETNLATRLGVSRATVRAALRGLETEGLVEVRPRRGTVVARMSLEDALEVCEVRGALEGRAARQACLSLREDDLAAMGDLAGEMGRAVRAGNVFRLVELDTAFHDTICRGTANGRLYSLWTSLNAQLGALMSSILESQHLDWQVIVDQHLRLCEVLATRDPDRAEAEVVAHYVQVWPSGPMPEESG